MFDAFVIELAQLQNRISILKSENTYKSLILAIVKRIPVCENTIFLISTTKKRFVFHACKFSKLLGTSLMVSCGIENVYYNQKILTAHQYWH